MLDDTAPRAHNSPTGFGFIGDEPCYSPGFIPGEFGVSSEVERFGPELVQHLGDSSNKDLSQRALVYSQQGQRINPNASDITSSQPEKRGRIYVETLSGNQLMIDGSKVFDLRESKRTGRAVAVEFDENERMPIIQIDKTWIGGRKDSDDPVVHVEVSLGEPAVIEEDDLFFEVRGEDPFAKFDNELWEIEEQYAERSKSVFSRLGGKALKGFAAAKAVVKAKSIAGRDRMREPNMVYGRRQALAVIAVAAMASYAAIEISDSSQDKGNNTIATHKEASPPASVNAAGRNPWVVSEWVLRKFGLNSRPDLEDIDHYDKRMAELTGIDITKGEDTLLPDDQVYLLPKVLPSEKY